jgi:hypothetical protein
MMAAGQRRKWARRVALGLVTALAPLALLWLSLPAIIRYALTSRAESRGWTLSVGQIEVGRGGVAATSLRGVPLRPLAAQAERTGVQLELQVETVRAAWPRWQEVFAGRSTWQVDLHGVNAQGRWPLGRGLLQGTARGGEFTLLRSAGSGTVEPAWRLMRSSLRDLSFQMTANDDALPALQTGVQSGTPTVDPQEHQEEGASRAQELLRLLEAHLAPDWPGLEIAQLAGYVDANRLAEIGMDGGTRQGLNVGPGSLTVRRNEKHWLTELRLGPPADRPHTEVGIGGEVLITAAMPREGNWERPTLHIKGGPVALSTLGIAGGQLGVVAPAEVQLTVDLGIAATPSAEQSKHQPPAAAIPVLANLTEWSLEGELTMRGLRLQDARLARQEVAFDALRVQGKITALVARTEGVRSSLRAIKLDQFKLGLGDVELQGKASLEKRETGKQRTFTLDARFTIPSTPCERVVEAIPRGLANHAQRIEWKGEWSLVWEVQLALSAGGPLPGGPLPGGYRLENWNSRLVPRNECEPVKVPEDVSVGSFDGSVMRTVEGPSQGMQRDREFAEVLFGRATREWTVFPELPSPVQAAFRAALLVSEDGRFERHGGFDPTAWSAAMEDNLTAGRWFRGGSTITMQLAKNLYLVRDKTIARKIDEYWLTTYLEGALSKVAILELYLNAVELGPWIYGVGPAAEHYFAKPSHALTAAECFFLVSILPKPSQEHFDANGLLQAARWAKVQGLMREAVKRGLLEPEALEDAVRPARFAGPDSPNL